MSVCEHRTRKECYQALCVPGQRARLWAEVDRHHAANLVDLAIERDRGDVIRMVADLGLLNSYHINRYGVTVPWLYTLLSSNSRVSEDILCVLAESGRVHSDEMAELRTRVLETRKLPVKQTLAVLRKCYKTGPTSDKAGDIVLAIKDGRYPIIENELKNYWIVEGDARILTAALESNDPVIIETALLLGFNHTKHNDDVQQYVTLPSFDDLRNMIPEWDDLSEIQIDFISRAFFRDPVRQAMIYQHISSRICPDVCQEIINFPFNAAKMAVFSGFSEPDPQKILRDVVKHHQLLKTPNIKSASKQY